MGTANDFCKYVMNYLKEALPKRNFIFAYENEIKDVPMKEIVSAMSIKKCVISDELYTKDENGIKILSELRDMTTTFSVNYYTPSRLGTAAGIAAFDDTVDVLLEKNWAELTGIRFLGTSYSRETQSLVTKAEFDIRWQVLKPSEKVEVTPIGGENGDGESGSHTFPPTPTLTDEN